LKELQVERCKKKKGSESSPWTVDKLLNTLGRCPKPHQKTFCKKFSGLSKTFVQKHFMLLRKSFCSTFLQKGGRVWGETP